MATELTARDTGLRTVALAERTPELACLWIRYCPRRWPLSGRPWTHLGEARLGPAGIRTAPPGGELPEVDDLVYLPPVAEEDVSWRDDLAAAAAESGTTALIQLAVGGPTTSAPGTRVYDPLQALLDGELERLESVPSDSEVVWPLIPGLTDDRELWEEGCGLLAERGVRGVQGLVLRLLPEERRWLASAAAGRSTSLFDALFHGPPPDERGFAQCANRHGLDPLLSRPEDPEGGRRTANRQVASVLATVGELWSRLGRSPAVAQEFFLAARWVESTRHDLRALAREGNLGVVERLAPRCRQLVEEWAADHRPELLQELRREYLLVEVDRGEGPER